MKPERVFLGLGSNLGDRGEHLNAAVGALDATDGFTLLTRSQTYATDAVDDPGGGPPFLNAAVAGVWDGAPELLLSACLEIEAKFGRVRTYRNAPRTLDIDILYWEGRTIDTPRLTVPHLRLTDRGFALLPLLELAPDSVEPHSRRPFSTFVTKELMAQGIRVATRETVRV